MPAAGEKSGQGVAQKSGANVAYMHGLSDIGRAEVDGDSLWVRCWLNPQAWILAKLVDGNCDCRWIDAVVYKPGASNFGNSPVLWWRTLIR